MSTKLHHGYKLALGTESLLSFSARLRAVLNPVYFDSYGRLLATIATTIADARARGEDAPEDSPTHMLRSPLMLAMNSLDSIKTTIDTTHTRVPAADFACDVAFLEDPQDQSLYALLFSERQEYRAAWESFDEVTPFPYWNNTDHPKEVTADEWELRRQIWDRVLPYADPVPAQRGISWSLLADIHHAAFHFVFHEENITPYIPTIKERARVIATRLANAHMDSIRTEPVADPDDPHGTSHVVRVLMAERPVRDAAIERLLCAVEPTLQALSYNDLIGRPLQRALE